MRAGRLRHRVQIQEATESRDSHGQPVKTWATKATVWAGVEPMRGEEKLYARQEANKADIKIILRYRSDINEDWRIVYGTRTFEIEHVQNPYERDKMLELDCYEMK